MTPVPAGTRAAPPGRSARCSLLPWLISVSVLFDAGTMMTGWAARSRPRGDTRGGVGGPDRGPECRVRAVADVLGAAPRGGQIAANARGAAAAAGGREGVKDTPDDLFSWTFTCAGRPRPAGSAVPVVPVVRLTAFGVPAGGLLNHDDGTSWWPGPQRWSIAVVAKGPGPRPELVPAGRELVPGHPGRIGPGGDRPARGPVTSAVEDLSVRGQAFSCSARARR